MIDKWICVCLSLRVERETTPSYVSRGEMNSIIIIVIIIPYGVICTAKDPSMLINIDGRQITNSKLHASINSAINANSHKHARYTLKIRR